MQKKLLGFLVVAFLIFFVMQSPAEAAEVFRETFEFAARILSGAAQALSTFLRSLF